MSTSSTDQSLPSNSAKAKRTREEMKTENRLKREQYFESVKHEIENIMENTDENGLSKLELAQQVKLIAPNADDQQKVWGLRKVSEIVSWSLESDDRFNVFAIPVKGMGWRYVLARKLAHFQKKALMYETVSKAIWRKKTIIDKHQAVFVADHPEILTAEVQKQ